MKKLKFKIDLGNKVVDVEILEQSIIDYFTAIWKVSNDYTNYASMKKITETSQDFFIVNEEKMQKLLLLEMENKQK